jgi:hypothetical protein
MAAKLTSYYDVIGKELGFQGRMKLAMLTKISSTDAQSAPDSPANIQLFEQSMGAIRRELGKS